LIYQAKYIELYDKCSNVSHLPLDTTLQTGCVLVSGGLNVSKLVIAMFAGKKLSKWRL